MRSRRYAVAARQVRRRVKGARIEVSASQEWLRTSMRSTHSMPPEVDRNAPSVSRAYDYALGGRNNFDVDRKAIDAIFEKFPGVRVLAVTHRSFLCRGVRYLVGEAGVRQLIDVGARLPNQETVHEIAHEIDPSVRVVYVDRDPVVLAHLQATLKDNDTVTTLQAELADPSSIFDNPKIREFLDFDKPIGVLLTGSLHLLSDSQDPVRVARLIKEAVPSGSYLLICNLLNEGNNEVAARLQQELVDRFGTGWFRTWEQQRPYFEGLELVEPGFVYANDWRPDEDTPTDSEWRTFMCGGLGRKP